MIKFKQFWKDLDIVPKGRIVPGALVVGIFGALVSLIASTFFIAAGLNLAYGDALSHLTIARRLFDTMSEPGLGQLGTVWLPAPHLLLSPLTVPMGLWSSGWSAALLGAICMGVTASSVFRIAARWSVSRSGKLLAVAIIVFNPTLLYLCSTALTEPVLIGSLAAAFSGLATWASIENSHSPGELAIFVGVPTAIAVLSRYEGWAMIFAGTALIVFISIRRKIKPFQILKNITGFALLPVLSILWWVAFNWVVFHDPLAFIFGQYSANAIQSGLVSTGMTTKGNVLLSFETFGTAVFGTVGPILLILTILFGLVLLIEKSFSKLTFVLTTTVTYCFMVLSLYLGQAVIFNNISSETNVWNNRYGMSTIIFATVVIALGYDDLRDFVSRHSHKFRVQATHSVALILLIGVVFQSVWIVQNFAGRSLVMGEAQAQMKNSQGPREAAKWLGENYSGGNILLDETVAENNIIPIVGLPLSVFYLRANDQMFASAVADPKTQVRWIWASTGDAGKVDTVTQKVLTLPDFDEQYLLVKEFDGVEIYKKRLGAK